MTAVPGLPGQVGLNQLTEDIQEKFDALLHQGSGGILAFSLGMTGAVEQGLLKLRANRVRRYLADVLQLPEYLHDARSSIVLDYTAWIILTCKELHLTAHQTMAVLAIGQQLLEGCAARASRSEAQALLRASLLQLCSPAAKTRSQAAAAGEAAAVCLSPDSISGLAAKFSSTLLQHYTLWSLVFTQEQQHVQHQHHLMVETPVPPLPLQQALPKADWVAHLAAEQAQREAEQAAAEAAEKAAREAEQAALLAQAQAEEAAARAEQLERKPKTLDEAVDKLVTLKLEDVRQAMVEDYAVKAAALSARVGQLESKVQQAAQLQQQLQASGGKGSSRVASAKSVASS